MQGKITKKEIGGRTFTLSSLRFDHAREVYAKIAPMLQAYGNEQMVKTTEALTLFVVAGMGNAISAEDLKFYCEKFGPTTTVDLDANAMLLLKNKEHMAQAFAEDNFADMFEWLDACVEHNFASVIAKIRGGLAKLKQDRPEAEAPSA